jgi:hypothetical protein
VKREEPFDAWICVVDSDGKNLARFCYGDWSHDSRKVFCVRGEETDEGTLLRSVIFDVATNTLNQQKGSWKGLIYGWLHTPDGAMVAVKDDDCTIKIIDTQSGNSRVVPEIKCNWPFNDFWWVELQPAESAGDESEPPEEEEEKEPEGSSKSEGAELRKRFEKAYDEWVEWCKRNPRGPASEYPGRVQNEYYREILALGPHVLPFMVEKLREWPGRYMVCDVMRLADISVSRDASEEQKGTIIGLQKRCNFVVALWEKRGDELLKKAIERYEAEQGTKEERQPPGGEGGSP